MKKAIAIIIAILTIFGCAMPVFAADATDSSLGTSSSTEHSDENSYETLAENAILLEYNYSSDFSKIEIHGNISYNALITYGKYRLEILRLTPSQTVENVIFSEDADVVAEMDIAAKFDFSIKVRSSADLFSKYAAVLRLDGKRPILAAAPKFVNINAVRNESTDSQYKGISLSAPADISVSGDMGFGSIIIPVYYDRLLSDNLKGYMYPFEDTYCYFDIDYINELDTQIRTHSMTGAKVYLQLLLPVNSTESYLKCSDGSTVGASYLMPDVYDNETVARISTYIRFLSGRYDTFSEGIIGGFIVGKNIDVSTSNYNGGLNLSDYAKRYAFYLNVVANSARMENKSIDIVIPLSDFNSYTGAFLPKEENYSTSQLMEEISKAVSEEHLTALGYSVLIESHTLPVESTQNGYKLSESVENIGIDNLTIVENFISALQSKYQGAPEHILYLWSVPENISGNMLKCAYAYSYYAILTKDKVNSFIIEVDNNSDEMFEECGKLLKSIDTKDGFVESNKLLQYFGVNSWEEIIVDFSDKDNPLRTELHSGKIDAQHYSFSGQFSYTAFSHGNLTGWNNGAYGKSIRLDQGIDGRRALHQTVSRAAGKAHSDLFHLYEYDENFLYTPILRFDVGITDSSSTKGELYEITVTVGKGRSSVTESYVVKSGEISQLWFYIGDFSSLNKAGYIKISSRSITGSKDEYSVWLYDMIGFSEKYDDAELDRIISSERSHIRNQINRNDTDIYENLLYWIVFAIIIVAITIGGVMFTIMRRDDVTVKRRR